MNWKLIIKDPQKQPANGTYTDWKEQIAEECYHQCVYCSIHEMPWGGIDHYHIDHYRPKSKKEFENLENDICNLFYACPICNRFKKDDWPGEPNDLNNICYPDPSKTDYSSLFNFNSKNFNLTGNYKSARYIIERLYLNRPQLLFERREKILKDKELDLMHKIKELLFESDEVDLMKEFIEKFVESKEHINKRDQIRPYKLSEIRKVGNK